MTHKPDADYGRDLVAPLRSDVTSPPPDLAARAAAAALAAPRAEPAFLDVLIPLGLRAVALGAIGAAAIALVATRLPTTSVTEDPMQLWWTGTTQSFTAGTWLAEGVTP